MKKLKLNEGELIDPMTGRVVPPREFLEDVAKGVDVDIVDEQGHQAFYRVLAALYRRLKAICRGTPPPQ